MPHNSSANLHVHLWRRIFALVYDVFILLALCSIAIYFTLQITIWGGVHNVDTQFQNTLPQFLTLTIIFTVATIYYCYSWHCGGQTIGMRAWHIKVFIYNTQQLPSYPQCFKRYCIALVTTFLLGIGLWIAFFRKDKRCLFDVLSHCQVLKIQKNVAEKQ